jgi:hypothetical protein
LTVDLRGAHAGAVDLAGWATLLIKPEYPEFAARTMWSLSNAFTSAFKTLDPIPQFKTTAKLGEFLSTLPAE